MDDKILADLFVVDDEFDKLEHALDVFCPFEAVGMVNQEIRHGHFLSYIFDPNRPHGFGAECLKALMRAAVKSREQLSANLSLLDVHLMDFQSAVVRPEWNKIDILIEIPDQNLIVAIELKIDAKEHSHQLSRYRSAVQREWPNHRHVLLFLTKRGDDPSEEDGEDWNSVELEQLALELEIVVRKSLGDPAAKSMLSAYLAMLGRHHLNDKELEDLAERLWARHREALEFLSDRRPDAVGDLFRRLIDGRDSLANQISVQCGKQVVVDYCRGSAIYFAIPEWDQIDQFKCADGFTPTNRVLLLEVAKAGSDYFRCYFIIGRGDQETRKKLFSTLKEFRADVGKKNQLTNEWNRLASYRISLKDIQDQDLDALTGRVFTQIREFASKHVPAYCSAFKALIN
ncbi:MAG: PD-(D/E)XK nuclease family protein [Chakrabartia sp.]